MLTKMVVGASGWRRLTVLLAAVATAVAILAAQGSAIAHDHQIPKTVLMKGAKELQVGLKVAYSSWTDIMDGETVTQTGQYAWRFPDKDRVAAESELRVRILKDERPETFSVTAYPRVVLNNGFWEPSGQGRLLRSSLRPVVQDGRTVAWDAVFRVNRPDRHYYLVSEGHWRDVQGADVDQHAFWSFHVKTRSSA